MPSAIVNNNARANPGLRIKLLAEYRRIKSLPDNIHSILQLETRCGCTCFVEVCSVFPKGRRSIPGQLCPEADAWTTMFSPDQNYSDSGPARLFYERFLPARRNAGRTMPYRRTEMFSGALIFFWLAATQVAHHMTSNHSLPFRSISLIARSSSNHVPVLYAGQESVLDIKSILTPVEFGNRSSRHVATGSLAVI